MEGGGGGGGRGGEGERGRIKNIETGIAIRANLQILWWQHNDGKLRKRKSFNHQYGKHRLGVALSNLY